MLALYFRDAGAGYEAVITVSWSSGDVFLGVGSLAQPPPSAAGSSSGDGRVWWSYRPNMSNDSLLIVRLNGEEIARINAVDPPYEIVPSHAIAPGAIVELEDGNGIVHRHSLAELEGWAHFSIRIQKNLACQADCVVTKNELPDPNGLISGNAKGIRFQPFFLSGSRVETATFRGQGLFARGLHYSGRVTPGSVRLSCECDMCH